MRERMVAAVPRRQLIVVEASKLVPVLGLGVVSSVRLSRSRHFPLPPGPDGPPVPAHAPPGGGMPHRQ